jgi:hypothetical protein
MQGDGDEQESTKQSKLIGKVLAPAVGLWLRSQTDHIEQLKVEIQAGDRQILAGYIQQVNLAAEQAVYKGLHLSQVQLVGQNIRVNLGQVVRGKPLMLLEPIKIAGKALLREADLNASLTAPLLETGVTQFLVMLLKANGEDLPPESDLNLQDLQIKLETARVVLAATLISTSGMESAIALRSSFAISAPNRLQLVNPEWLPHANAKRGLAIDDLNGYEFDLGEDTQIESLEIAIDHVSCQARLLVRP